MATSQTFSYLPTSGELVLTAYSRIQIRRSEIINEHLQNAGNECNLLQVTWANLGPILFTVDLQTVNLVQGQATYSVPANTVMVNDLYMSVLNGDGTNSDRITWPLSRTEYASVPNKSQQGSPTSFWFDRLASPTLTFWPVPDGNNPTFSYYRFAFIQDAVLAGALNPAIPYLWLDAWVAGLAHRLAIHYRPELEAAREATAIKAYNVASTQGTENVLLYITPQTQSYWR
jgi:hypothetical protein